MWHSLNFFYYGKRANKIRSSLLFRKLFTWWQIFLHFRLKLMKLSARVSKLHSLSGGKTAASTVLASLPVARSSPASVDRRCHATIRELRGCCVRVSKAHVYLGSTWTIEHSFKLKLTLHLYCFFIILNIVSPGN